MSDSDGDDDGEKQRAPVKKSGPPPRPPRVDEQFRDTAIAGRSADAACDDRVPPKTVEQGKNNRGMMICPCKKVCECLERITYTGVPVEATLLPPDEQAALIDSMQGHWKITTPTVDWQAPDAVNRGLITGSTITRIYHRGGWDWHVQSFLKFWRLAAPTDEDPTASHLFIERTGWVLESSQRNRSAAASAADGEFVEMNILYSFPTQPSELWQRVPPPS